MYSHHAADNKVVGEPVPAPALPPGLFGATPRTVVLHRDPRHGFGFTLRHLVVYPPESLNDLYEDGRLVAVGVLGAPMDTIFVRSVRGGGPAAAAGLRAGDRVVAVNDEPVLCGGGRQRAPYARVVQLGQRESVLQLAVVPREHDLLQRYFSEAAYNPETNQRQQWFEAAGQAPPRRTAPDHASLASWGSDPYEARREWDGSPPAAADSSGSLASFDSASALSLSRIRKSLEQKEAFLRRPSQPTGWVTLDPPRIKQKEFYARPQKMPKTWWPPTACPPAPGDGGTCGTRGGTCGTRGGDVRPRSKAFVTAPGSSVADHSSVANSNPDNSKRGVDLQLVTARAQQLEWCVARDGRTALHRSELARLSTTRAASTVALRRHEFEARGTDRTEKEAQAAVSASLSGNQLLVTGCKQLHCPPPAGYAPEVENVVQMRARSNSAGGAGTGRRAPDVSGNKRRYGLNKEQMEAMNRSSVADEPDTERKSLEDRLVVIRPQRPTQLSLAPEETTSSLSAATTPASQSPTTPADSGFADDSITRRQKKDAKMGEEEGSMRRVSYLKATWGDRLHGEPADLLQFPPSEKKDEETLQQATEEGVVDMQGLVQVKMVVSSGKANNEAESARWLRNLKRHSATAASAEADQTVPRAQRSDQIGHRRAPTGPTTPTLQSSLKTKTWKGRMAWQLRRIKGGGGQQTASHAAATGWLGAPLERCPADANRPGVPLAVTLCAAAVEEAGLKTVGIYRVPGNVAGIAALAAALDRGEPPPPRDPKWADVHVASSLLKTYLRKLPDALLTTELYPALMAAERSAPRERTRRLRRLVWALPDAHYATLKFLVEHLRRVVAHSDANKMEARNLAIVFGPTLVRGAGDDMLALVNDMSSQCRIIESLLNHYEWYFDEEESGAPAVPPGDEELAPSTDSRQLLLHNVKKIEGDLSLLGSGVSGVWPGKDVTPRDIMSCIISAANRKMQRKPRKSSQPSVDTSRAARSPPAQPARSPPAQDGQPAQPADALEGAHGRTHAVANQSTRERVDNCRFEEETMLQRRGDPARAAAVDLVGKELQALSGKHFNTIAIDGTGDLVSTLTSTFDQKLRTLNNLPAELGRASSVERVSPSMRTHELKTAWLRGDHRQSSSHSAEDDNRSANSSVRQSSPETEKNDAETLSEDDKSLEMKSSPLQARAILRPTNPKSAKQNGPTSDANGERDPSNKENGEPGRSESASRSPEGAAVRVLRAESFDGRQSNLQWSESFKKENVRRQLGAKLKRKNGMPERGIKRRHTVGGTQDFDKGGWRRRHARASSPDLALASLCSPPLESHV